ncbi:MAG: hypothetical protein HZB84_06870 [Deltaproteobacteria bacterium]|nr:hypothetical protein [Deltaproteobacteria bacterium]
MECPYLKKGMSRSVCNASVTLMTLDMEGAEGHCTTEENYRCPMLLALFLREGRKNGPALRSLQ